MKISIRFAALAVAAAVANPSHAADTFAAVGTRATLSVEFRFEASGKTQDKTDLREWRVKRGADVVAELVAQKPQPLSGMQPPEAAQMAKVKQVVPMGAGSWHGASGDGGNLVVRWRFVAS